MKPRQHLAQSALPPGPPASLPFAGLLPSQGLLFEPSFPARGLSQAPLGTVQRNEVQLAKRSHRGKRHSLSLSETNGDGGRGGDTAGSPG